MFSPNHILAVSVIFLELTLIPQPPQRGQQDIERPEKARVVATPSRVSCPGQPQASSSVVSCAEEEFRKKGKPLMSPPQHGIAFGVSAPSADSTDVFIWMDNRTDQTQSYGMMCSVSYLGAFEVYDSAGERVLSKAEQRSRQLRSPVDGIEELEICSCCILQSIPPHTLQVVDYGKLGYGYALSPGSYFIVPVDPRTRKLELSKMDQAGTASFLSNGIKMVIPSH